MSLNEGVVDIDLAPGNTVTVNKIREVIRANGFTPKASDVRVEGKVVARKGMLALEVTGLGETYRLFFTANDRKQQNVDALRQRMGKEVIVAGTIRETTDASKSEPLKLVVQNVTPAGR